MKRIANINDLGERMLDLWDGFLDGTVSPVDANIHVNFCNAVLKVKIASAHMNMVGASGNLLDAPVVESSSKVVAVRPYRRRQAGMKPPTVGKAA
jgi:hypothetical protein